MKANYIDYMKLWNRLYSGVALTEERLSENALNIINYLRDGGAAALMNRIGIGIRIKYVDEKPVEYALQFTSGDNAGRQLSIDEVKHIGLLLMLYWNEIE